MTVLVKTAERGEKRAETVCLCGVRFRCLTLPRNGLLAPVLARRAAKKLRSEKVRKAVFEKGFPFTDIFAKYGIFPPAVYPLRRAAVRQIVSAALKMQGVLPQEAFLAVRAENAGEETEAVLLALAPCVRALALDAPGEESAAARLLFRCGLALRKNCFGADLALSLLKGDMCAEGLLALYDEKLCIGYDVPEEWVFESEAFLAALLENEAIRGEEIAVLRFDVVNVLTSEEKNSIMLCT